MPMPRREPVDVDFDAIELLDSRCFPFGDEKPIVVQRRLRWRIGDYCRKIGGTKRFATHLIEPLQSIAIVRIA